MRINLETGQLEPKKRYEKEIRCACCEGTGLQEVEGRTFDCRCCEGRGMRKVMMTTQEWNDLPAKERVSISDEFQ